MLDNHATASHFSRAASHYAQHAGLQQLVRTHAMTFASRYWQEGAKLLDLGCGTGQFALESSHAGTRWQVLGIDWAHGMCQQAATVCRAAICADAHQLPLADGSMDGVFSSLMLQWCNAPQQVFLEMARVLKQGAAAILTVPTHGTLAELKEAFAAVDDTPHISEFMEAYTLMGYAARAGFSCLHLSQETITEYYPDSIALMRSLQAIGATNAHHARRRSLMTPRQFARLEQAYEARRSARGLPASWQIVFLVLRKDC
ncbi:MAG: methyltransferase domain-containing protein [Alphaproteobacteria bacterium]|nr:methyltransferase domain-containing protein [Alphaproteobacteria bacterium]